MGGRGGGGGGTGSYRDKTSKNNIIHNLLIMESRSKRGSLASSATLPSLDPPLGAVQIAIKLLNFTLRFPFRHTLDSL